MLEAGNFACEKSSLRMLFSACYIIAAKLSSDFEVASVLVDNY